MCKSSQPQQGAESGAAAAPVLSEAYQVADGYKVPDQAPQQEQHVLAHDESSGVVIFGSFVAGALVGVIICAPTFVVLLFGAGAAAVTRSDSKVCERRRRKLNMGVRVSSAGSGGGGCCIVPINCRFFGPPMCFNLAQRWQWWGWVV